MNVYINIILSMEPCANGTYEHIGARGGTELMLAGLRERMLARAPDVWNAYHIICSRVRFVDPQRRNLLWLHDLAEDPENAHLQDPALRRRFHKLIFVSYFQKWTFSLRYNIPWEDSIVLRNAIVPIEPHVKDPDGPIRLIYHTTPHRGLALLVPVFEHLCATFPNMNIQLDVYSSFRAYNNPERDAMFESIFERCRGHPKIHYHGYQENAVIREALKKAHIYAYPNIWQETSCISVIEAMSAGCKVVCSDYGALPETCAGFADMYPYDKDANIHANRFYQQLLRTIRDLRTPENQQWLIRQKEYFDRMYAWDARLEEWIMNAFGTQPHTHI